MSVIIIPRKHLRQPQGRVTLADEFSNATMAFCGTELDVSQKRQIQFSRIAGPMGVHLTNNSSALTIGQSAEWLPSGAQVTVLLGGRVLSGTDSPVFTTDSTATDAANIYLPFSDGNVYWRWGGEVAGVSSLSVSGLTFKDSDLWALTAGPRGMEIWQNGSRVAHQAGSASRAPSSTQMRLGYYVGAATIANLSLFLLAVLPRQLDVGFLSSRQYFSIFRADPIRIYSLPSGPISISWSSLTASNITQTGARLTLGGIVR